MTGGALPLAAVALTLSGATAPLSLQSVEKPLVPSRSNGPTTLGGRVDEPAWKAIAPLPVAMYQPVFLGPMTERTEIRLAYDDVQVYVGARIHVDSAVTNDAEGDWLNTSRDMVWDAATSRSNEGCFAEIRIPLASQRFDEQGSLRFTDRNQRLDTHVASLRTRAALNSRLSSHVLIQCVSAPGSWGTNCRLRTHLPREPTSMCCATIGVRALRASPLMRRTARA